MAMQKRTLAKLANYYKTHEIGTTVVGLTQHTLDTSVYPCWETLKRVGAVVQTSREEILWSHGEGEEETVIYTKYKVVNVL